MIYVLLYLLIGAVLALWSGVASWGWGEILSCILLWPLCLATMGRNDNP
jgi:hypothetical protein